MKNIRSMKVALAGIALLVGATFASPAQAAVISVTPALQTVGLGDPATVNLDVTLAQGESTGGFALRLAFNPAILGSGINVVFDPGGFLGAGPLTGVNNSVAGQVDIDATALVESLPNQGSGFTLATVTFLQTTGLGTSPVNIIDALGGLLSNADGTEIGRAHV